jgi:hypothetical protein
MRQRTRWIITAFWLVQHVVLGCLAIVPLGWFLTALARRLNHDVGSRNSIVIHGRVSPFEVPADQITLMMVAGLCGVIFLAGVAVLISLMLSRWLPRPVVVRWGVGVVLGLLPFVLYWFLFTERA